MWRLQATFVLFWGVAAGVYAQELDRPLRAVQEFNDDTRDAGDLGAGHSVTALYEIIPADSDEPVPGVDPLRYRQVAPQPEVGIDEVLTVKLRYKQPGESESRLVARTLTKPEAGDDGPSEAFRFASAVAEFGLLLRDSPCKGEAAYERAYERAREALGADEDGRRSELLALIRAADDLTNDLLALIETTDGLTLGQARSVSTPPCTCTGTPATGSSRSPPMTMAGASTTTRASWRRWTAPRPTSSRCRSSVAGPARSRCPSPRREALNEGAVPGLQGRWTTPMLSTDGKSVDSDLGMVMRFCHQQ